MVSTDIILYGLLPSLLFGETLRLNWLRVKQSFVASSLLAGPGALFVVFQLACFAYICLPFSWNWNYCFLFGSILCATDPGTVQ